MNNSIEKDSKSINTTQFYFTKEQLFEIIGYSQIIEDLNVYLLTILNGLGVILNLVSFFIFKSNRFKSTPIFDYFKVYTLNSAILCLFMTFNFLSSTYDHFDVSYKYEMKIYSCYVYSAIFTTTYFYSAVLDVYISLERLFNFKPSLTRIKNLSFKMVCSFLFIVCLAINFPYFFVYDPIQLDASLDGKYVSKVYLFGFSEFGKSDIGKIITLIIYFIRDVVTLIMEVILNTISIFLLKKHLSLKKDMMFHKSDKRTVDESQDKATPDRTDLHNITTEENHLKGNNNLNIIISNKNDFLNKVNKNITIMVVAMCILSAIMHLSFINCTIIFTITQDTTAGPYCFASNLTISLKHFSNFFFFLFFNHLFFEQLKNTFRKKNRIQA